MKTNLIDVKLDFYGLPDFQPSLEWPQPRHASAWLKDHYTYTQCDSPFGKYHLGITMISGQSLADRMCFELLRVNFGTDTEELSTTSLSFLTNTNLVSRFEVAMDDLFRERRGWFLYQSERNMAVDMAGFDSEHEDALMQGAGQIKSYLEEGLETALRLHSIKNVMADKDRYPTASSMLIDLFVEYKEAVYDWNRKTEPHLNLAHSR